MQNKKGSTKIITIFLVSAELFITIPHESQTLSSNFADIRTLQTGDLSIQWKKKINKDELYEQSMPTICVW